MAMNESGAPAPYTGPGGAPCTGSGGAPYTGLSGAERAASSGNGVVGGGKPRAFRHSMKRRCFVHDYKGRSIYLVTLEVAGRRPLLGRIVTGLRPTHRTGEAQSGGHRTGEPPRGGRVAGAAAIPLAVSGLSEIELKAVNAPLFEPSELGRRVAEEFMKIGEHVPGVKPLLAQAMPDHFHGILFVTREINRSLGSIMAGFKGKCSQIAQGPTPRAPDRLGAPRVSASESLWESGYHDRILTSEGQLEKMIRYVIDNPRRAALRLVHRELFTGVRRLTVNGRVFEAYGNGFLLQRPEIVQVQCSRRFLGFKRVEKLGLTPSRDGLPACAPNHQRKIARGAMGEALVAFETPEFAAKKAELFEAAKNGAVLCSPCISDGEKAIAYAAVDAGYPLIILRNEPFPPRFKPSGRFFDACAEGRLLMLYPLGLTPLAPDRYGLTAGAPNQLGGDGRQPARITRTECLALNAIVAEICGGDAGEIIYHGLVI